MQSKAMERYKRDLERYESELKKHKILESVWEKESKKAAGDGIGIDDFAHPPPDKPALRRYLVNDATIEKLHETLEENPQGILLVRDELVGWFAGLEKRGRESERPFFLEAWNGDGSYTVDRIGRGTLHVPNLCISVFGGIQPAKLERYLSDAVTGGFGDDGMAQRLQVLVWPDPPAEWENIDTPPDSISESKIVDLFERIARMSPENPMAHHFDGKAQQLFDEYRRELEHRLRREGMPAVLESHLAKFRSLMPSLAVIFHIAEDSAASEIPLMQAQRAAAFCAYLESHARRVYSCVVGHENRAAVALGEKVKVGQFGSEFSTRDVYLKKWTGLNNPERVRIALATLEEAGWVRRIERGASTQGGRPSERYAVNPEVFGGQ